MKRTVRWNVAPRYTPGSPAMVDEGIARHVLADERECYLRALDGTYGEAARLRAVALGTEWVVFLTWEKGNKLYREDCTTRKVVEVTKVELLKEGTIFTLAEPGAHRFKMLPTWKKESSGLRCYAEDLELVTRSTIPMDRLVRVEPGTTVWVPAALPPLQEEPA